jgi:hypothetical protein
MGHGYDIVVTDAPYREPVPPKPADGYAAFWASLRRRRPWGQAGIVLLFPGLFLLILIGERALLVGLPILAVALAMLVYAGPGACPRCSKKFDRKGAYHNQFTRHCLNCGITIGTPKGSP